MRLTAAEAPALGGLAGRRVGARLGDLLRNPEDRDEPLHAVPLLVLRGERRPRSRPTTTSCSRAGDELLLAGRPAARRALDTTLFVDAVARVRRHRPAGAVELDLAEARAHRRCGADAARRPGIAFPVPDEDLQGLVRRRLWELARTPAEAARLSRWTVPPETIERMARRGGKSFISEGMAEFLARALGVPENRVRRAAGLPRPRPACDIATRPHLRLVREEDER